MEENLRTHHKTFIDQLKKERKSHSTILAYGKDVEQFIEFAEQKQQNIPSKVTETVVDAFAHDLREKRYTEKSIVRKLNSVKAFFSFLQDQKVLVHNPVTNVKKPKIENGAPRVLTKIEYRALRDACRSDRRVSAIVEVLLQTGMRISELAALKMLDLDLSKKVVTLQDPESKISRTVPLNNAAVNALEEYLSIRPKTREKTVFITKTCKPFLVRNIRAAIDRYFKIAGIQGAKVNDLRHTFIVEQLSAGTPLLYISQIVGHKRITTTEKYLQLIGNNFDTSSVRIEEL